MNIDDLKTSIGRKIYELRKKHSYSKKYIREKTDISEQMQKQYEDGTTKKLPSTDILFRLSEFYNVPLNYFFSDTWSEVSKPQKRNDSLLDVAKLLVDLSTNENIYFAIEKKEEQVVIRSQKMRYYAAYGELPEEFSKFKNIDFFKFTIYDCPNIARNIVETEDTILSNDEYTEFTNQSILGKFYDKLLTYNSLYEEKKIDIDDYNTLCQKALNIVESEEKYKNALDNALDNIDFSDFDDDDTNTDDLPF